MDAAPIPLPPNGEPRPGDRKLTPFQRSVVDAVERLAPGDLITYGELAEELGRPGAAQAVANVLRSVPGLPWWRVLPGDGRLYRTHAPTQGPLLVAEGHWVDGDRRVRPGVGRRSLERQRLGGLLGGGGERDVGAGEDD